MALLDTLSRRLTATLRLGWRLGCMLGSLAALTACSTVPNSGPNKTAVMAQGTQPNAPFLLVQLSDFAIQELQHYPGPSLYGKFGDYRAPIERRVGVGDIVNVTVFEAASGGLFSTPVSTSQTTGAHSSQIPPQTVQRDGAITVPYAGRIQVVGKTTQEVQKFIVEKLAGKAIEPQALVSLTRNISSAVTVTGEVTAGARVPLSTRGERLLDVVATVGGIRSPASESFIDLTRGGQTVRVPFQTLINSPKENIWARPGDVLTVVRYPLTFTAVGATGSNSVVPFSAIGISLEEAVGKASGLSDSRADPEGVFVFRYEPISVVRNYPGLTPQQASLNLVPTVYLVNMRDPAQIFLARRFNIHDKDIVFVSDSPLIDIQKLGSLASSIASPTLQATVLAVGIAN